MNAGATGIPRPLAFWSICADRPQPMGRKILYNRWTWRRLVLVGSRRVIPGSEARGRRIHLPIGKIKPLVTGPVNDYALLVRLGQGARRLTSHWARMDVINQLHMRPAPATARIAATKPGVLVRPDRAPPLGKMLGAGNWVPATWTRSDHPAPDAKTCISIDWSGVALPSIPISHQQSFSSSPGGPASLRLSPKTKC